MSGKIRLGVNIDHIATLRNARNEGHPDLVEAARFVEENGGDIITVHLREDRRHIKDKDVYDLRELDVLPLNLEIAATEEMLEIALDVKPYACCIVPEKREELTTEGGLDVVSNLIALKPFVRKLQESDILVSIFIDADIDQLDAVAQTGAEFVEFHTGKYCNAKKSDDRQREYDKLYKAVSYAKKLGIRSNAGHGLNYETTEEIIKIPDIEELNIGHFIISESIFYGLPKIIRKFKKIISDDIILQ